MKANIDTKEGTKIVIDGTVEEVARIVEMFKEEEMSARTSLLENEDSKRDRKSSKKTKLSATDLISNLQVDGFFNKPRSLAEIKQELEKLGNFYPMSTLSGIVLGLIKKRKIRRIKQNKIWGYVK